MMTGPQLWEAIHRHAWQHPREATAEQQRQAREWLAGWAGRIPRYGCDCRSEWRQILRLCPPPLHNGPAYYWWTVAAHDRINRRLGKPLAAPDWSRHHPLLRSN